MVFRRIRDLPARAEIALFPAAPEFGPTERMTAEEIMDLENFLDNQDVINNLESGTQIDATLQTLLEAIVEKQQIGEAEKQKLQKQLELIKDVKIPVSPEQLELGLERFQTEAIKGYQRIASTTISIIEGEISALTTGVPGAFSFEGDVAQEMRRQEIQMFGGPNVVRETNRFLEAYEQQIDDVLAALRFMLKEMELTKDLLVKEEELLKTFIDLDSPFQITAEVSNLIKATSQYMEILAETSWLENAIKYFTNAHRGIKKTITKDKFDKSNEAARAWGSATIQGMATFAKFACRLSKAEADLNKLNQVDGAGVVRRGLGRAFSDIITLDQKFYPMNNQIPLPPISVSPVIINAYLEAYEERARELVVATENQLNQINNKFDRKVTTAQRNIGQLSELLLMPKPAARSSISREQVVDAIETPEAFYMRTAGIPTRDRLERDLDLRRSRNRELGTQYAVELGAMPVARARIAEATAAEEEEQARLLMEAEAAAQRATDAASRSMGSNVMKVNPRKKRRRKK